MLKLRIHLLREQRIRRVLHVASGLAERVGDRRRRQRREHRRELRDRLHHTTRTALGIQPSAEGSQHNAACAGLGDSKVARNFCVPRPH